MNILIFAGGTGSIALQTGLHAFFKNHEDIDIKVLTNAYDNGKSTGTVRKVLNGHILGPSDVRKNQTTRLSLEQPESPWLKFLDIRFSCPANDAQTYCLTQIDELEKILIKDGSHQSCTNVWTDIEAVKKAVKRFFSAPMATKVDYTDFSLANIIYAGFAALNGMSLRQAATKMSKILGIADNVLLNDDESLFLGAVTQSGIRLTDEGDIVEWGSMTDPITDIFFTSADGKDRMPILNKESIDAIAAADLIILSSGTQWSSLIPTYASIGFADAIANSKADIIMVMNSVPDKDSPGQTADDIINAIVPRYFPKNRIAVLCNNRVDPKMEIGAITKATAEKVKSVSSADMSIAVKSGFNKLHSPYQLVDAILRQWWNKAVRTDAIICDYDDTLVARGNENIFTSTSNIEKLSKLNAFKHCVICTGNSIKAVNTGLFPSALAIISAHQYNPVTPRHIDEDFTMPGLTVFADGGINEYEFNFESGEFKFIKCIQPELAFSADESLSITKKLIQLGFPSDKIEIRGKNVTTCISIKPVDENFRAPLIELLKITFPDLSIHSAGRSTIDISKPGLSKKYAIEKTILKYGSVLYLGDEVENGNDKIAGEIAKNDPQLTVINVKSVLETNIILSFFHYYEQIRSFYYCSR